MNTTLFGEPLSQGKDKYRTEAGTLRAGCMKAIKWFAIENGLRPLAASAYPTFFFKDQSGNEQRYDIGYIVEQYDEFRGKTHGRKVAS